jgi:hypothetical protein
MVDALTGNRMTEGLRGPSVFLLAILAFAPACTRHPVAVTGPQDAAGSGDSGPGFLEDGESLWDTPPLPAPIAMRIGGEAVPAQIFEGYLASPWNEFVGAPDQEGMSPDEVTARFYADGPALFGELARGVILLREAESQFPELDPVEFEHYRMSMLSAAGQAVFDAIERNYGPEGVTAHVERRLRLHKLEQVFATVTPEVSDEELYEIYDKEVLANMTPEQARNEGIDISFAAMEPRLRGPLQQRRVREQMELWIDEHIGGVEVEVDLASGDALRWTETTPESAFADGEEG